MCTRVWDTRYPGDRTKFREVAGVRQQVDRRCRILVIDDEPQNTKLLERVLAREGFENVQALNESFRALPIFRSFEPDLVVLDLHMPKPDGYDLLEQFDDEMGEDDFVPILVLTADATETTRLRALDCGATDFLSKPLQVNEVTARINNMLHTRLLHSALRRHSTKLELEVESLRANTRDHQRRLREIASRTQDVIDGNGMVMVFQPVVDMHTGTIVGAEALARFTTDPGRPPDVWFREAAEVDMGTALEMAAINQALEKSSELMPPDAFLSVNTSPTTLRSSALTAALDRNGPRAVVVELTEHEQVEDYGPLTDAMRGLRERGARIAVDDTGSGFASLHHLLEIHPDIVKLDRFLISGIDRDPVKEALATALIHFSQEVGIDVIAEGIETDVELEGLRNLGFAWAQGYFLARPGHLPFEPDLLARLESIVETLL